MKRLLTLMFILPCISFVYAQEANDYRPFIEDGKVWYLSNNEGLYHIPRRNYFDGDTLIAGRKCKKWIQEEGIFQQAEMAIYKIYAYEEDKRICFFQEGDTIPRLFFDFGAEVGDTLVVQLAYARVFANLTSESGKQTPSQEGIKKYESLCTDTLIITQRGEKEYGGCKQRCIWFHYIKNGKEKSSLWDFMMEGVGALTAPYWNFPSLTRLDLLACTVGDEVLFWDSIAADYWGLSLPTTISSPQMINGERLKGKCFDLTGRRLAAPPVKGVYIMDGKIKVKTGN